MIVGRPTVTVSPSHLVTVLNLSYIVKDFTLFDESVLYSKIELKSTACNKRFHKNNWFPGLLEKNITLYRKKVNQVLILMGKQFDIGING